MSLVSRTRWDDREHRDPSTGGGSRRGLRLAKLHVAALLVFLGAFLLLPTVALAEQPFRMGSQVEDRVGALRGREQEVRAALDRLTADDRVQLWVAYVDSFEGVGAQEWADETAALSDLGLTDVLLAVAVEDRAYAYSVDLSFPLDDDGLTQVMAVAVEPSLIENDWAGAVVGAAGGLSQALRGATVTTITVQPGDPTPGGEGGFPWGVVVGLIVLAAVVAGVWSLARRSRRKSIPGVVTGDQAGTPALSLDELRRKASAELVHADDAVKTSADEVGFAVAQFGEEEAAPFQRALDEARSHLDEAFRLHRQVEDVKDEAQQRELFTAILQHTEAASRKLDEQAERFDRLRDLEKNAPKVLASLEGRLTALEARVPEVQGELQRLAAVYSPAALAGVSGNVDEAVQRISFSREQVRAGLEDVEAGRTGEAAITSLAAEEAAVQAETLLDAVGRLGRDLQTARGRIEAAIAETQRDVAEARAAQGRPDLGPLVARAEAAVAAASAAASPNGGEDPLASLRHLEEADEALEQALVQVREENAQRARAAQALDRSLMAARAEIATASDYITTHRGAVGSGARTLLAEAQRNHDQAVSLGVSDPITASRLAAGAHELAGRALREAQSDVNQAMGGGMGGFGGGSSGGGMGGALAGALIGGILSGALGGGGFGGSSGGGGFSPPSFGGTGTRMRRGGGGRF